ncbi:hypothetical protein BBJ28_00015436 [Nothophytophthora sp. Chile5]|nr:hypothetical protein BBJ28_00015436 [Nothophytophthora sp. Chile5]
MRWGSGGNGSLGVAAAAYALASRGEDAQRYYYYASTAASGAASDGSQPLGHAAGALHAKKPLTKRPGRRSNGSSTRFPRPPGGLKTSTANSEGAEDPAITSMEATAAAARRSALITCAGKSVYSQSSDSGDNNASNSDEIVEPSAASSSSRPPLDLWQLANSPADTVEPLNRVDGAKAATTMGMRKGSTLGLSPPRQRTDEELEQVIRELRAQIFQQQHQRVDQAKKLAPISSSDRPGREEDKQSQTHHRRHLKNPVERMQSAAGDAPTAAPVGSNSTNDLLLHRHLSRNHLCRLVTESTTQMVIPAVIYGASALSTTISTGRSSVSSDDGGQTARQTPRLGEGAVLNPRQLRPKRQLSARLRQEKEKFRDLECCERPSSARGGFLYLVGVEDCGDIPESLSLSPVGPWVVSDLAATGWGSATPSSPSTSTCYSKSSAGDDARDGSEDDGEQRSRQELAMMSPRSRLLSFSGYEYDNQVPRSSGSALPHRLRRSATCASSLSSGRKSAGSGRHAAGSTSSKRCSSAKATPRGGSRAASAAASATLAETVRPKATAKRRQSGRLAIARSVQSDSSFSADRRPGSRRSRSPK